MEDFSEYTPLDGVAADSSTGTAPPQPLCARLPLRCRGGDGGGRGNGS
ncbi:MAG: hypothetical protein IPG64_11000 [Haliea sp.]|nr:hypothetical protein [Haliea sp.]